MQCHYVVGHLKINTFLGKGTAFFQIPVHWGINPLFTLHPLRPSAIRPVLPLFRTWILDRPTSMLLASFRPILQCKKLSKLASLYVSAVVASGLVCPVISPSPTPSPLILSAIYLNGRQVSSILPSLQVTDTFISYNKR